jgi:hypothetical protein
MTDTYEVKGHCLCGAVTYAATAESHDVHACHCGMCRRWTGGPLVYIHAVGKPVFTGTDQLGVYRSSDWGERGFCRKCGSILFWKTVGQDRYTLAAGSLDDQSGLVFKRQIFIDDKPDYYDFANETIKLTGAESMGDYTGTSGTTE